MNAPAREEIDAKLETIEVRMDGRVAAIEAKIDGLVGVLNERFKRIDERMERIETATKETQASIGDLKKTMLVTALSSVIAIVLGVATFNTTLFSNMAFLFESGKNSGIHEAELKRQTEATAALLKQLQAQTAPVPPPKH